MLENLQFISGLINPSSKYMSDLAKALNTTTDWINTGTSDGTPLSQLETGGISEWDSNTPLDDDEVEVVFFKDVSFACGSGSIGEALDTEKRAYKYKRRKSICYRPWWHV